MTTKTIFRRIYLPVTLLLAGTVISAFSACGTNKIKSAADIEATGWYQVDSENNIQGNILFSASDFSDLHLDTIPTNSLPYMHIRGRIVRERRNNWTDITEQLIGKQIGFVYNDTVITAPKINCRMESGNFQIISEDKELLKTIYTHLISRPR